MALTLWVNWRNRFDPAASATPTLADLATKAEVAALGLRVTTLEKPPAPPPVVIVVPPSETPVRTIGPGTIAGLTVDVPGLWLLDPLAIVAGKINVTAAGAHLRGGQCVLPASTNEWASGYDISIGADDATIESMKIRGGGFGVGVFGAKRTTLRAVDIAGTYGGSLAVWSQYRGADDFLAEDCRFVVTSSTPLHRTSPVIGRADNGQPVNQRGIFRRCSMDQGPEGHFGLEWFDGPGLLIDGGEYRGGEVLISPGRSHGLKVLNAKLHLGGRTHSAVEVATINDAEVAGCVADSTDAYSGTLAWVTNGSARTNVHNNTVTDMYAVVNPDNRPGAIPTALRVTDNAGMLTKYVVGPPVPPDAIVTGNAVSA